ncbi:MAG: hypothetical protein PF484_04870, partial [Bacteroidales bacterium]|nr:hypothetical protein [Bacteroidales bacterium]
MVEKGFNFNKVSIVLMAILFLVSVSAAPILNELHLNIQTTDGLGKVITGTFDFDFNISTTADCNSVIYSKSANLATDSRGIVSFYLENVALSYDSQYYLCYYRDSALIEAAKISQSPYAYTAQSVDLGGVNINQNLNMGTFNVTATNFFGDGSGLTNIDVGSIDLSAYYNKTFVYNQTEVDSLLGSGAVNSSNYWDGLNTPADILGSGINNDLGWINFTSLSQFSNDLGIGNWTLDKPNYYTNIQTYNKSEVDSIVSIGTVNSSNYWDGLNTPGDILGSLIQNNLGWTNFTKLSEMTNDLGIGNWTLDKPNYYNFSEVDTAIGTANTSMRDYVDSAVSSGDVNSSAFWDSLDSPADILGSEINNDLSWVELANLVGLVGNWSQDKVNYYLINQVYNQSEV